MDSLKLPAALGLLLLLTSPALSAQSAQSPAPDDTVAVTREATRTQVRSARELMEQLDGLAQSCMTEIEENGGAEVSRSQACSGFRQALDDQLLADYLEHCLAARQWRDRFVAEQGADPATPADSESLELLLAVDYACGENALVQHTRFVQPVYRALYRAAPGTGEAIDQQLRSLEFELDSERERERLRRSLEAQRQERAAETRRQMDRLEEDLLRQELSRQRNP